MRYGLGIIVLIASLGACEMANAELVKYYTTGYFSIVDPSHPTGTGNTQQYYAPGGVGTFAYALNEGTDGTPGVDSNELRVDNPWNGISSHLDYWFQGSATSPVSVNLSSSPASINLGYFTTPSLQGDDLTSGLGNLPVGDYFTFTLVIHQLDPTTGSAISDTTLTGSLGLFGPVGSKTTGVELTFSPDILLIPPTGGHSEVYTIEPPDGDLTIPATSATAQTYIAGTVAAPLPSTAQASLVLFGLVGAGGYFSRRMKKANAII